MRKRKIMIALLLVTSLACNFVLNVYTPREVMASDKENRYIIITSNMNDVKDIEAKYDSIMEVQSQETDLLEQENILVAKLNETKVSVLEKDDQIQKVEEDILVEASTVDAEIEDCVNSIINEMQNDADIELVEQNSEEIETLEEIEENVEESVVLDEVDADEIDTEVLKSMSDDSQYWNIKTINADYETKVPNKKVKVALLDSGVDVQENINVAERCNLIPDSEISPLFEDLTGHGTSIASLLVGTSEEVKGINPNVELYSVRILDENNQAPISRVIEGIYWAIEKEVDIISISFGTNQYSEALEKAISDANREGILVVAAAGNQGEDAINNVEYPAAFENVLAVGSVDSKANISSFSSTGDEIDVVAPGEAVRVAGAFGETMVASGTSLAVPHVVGVASMLWQEDLSKSKEFIKQLLQSSSHSLGDSDEYGYGLVDYEYADEMYSIAEEQFDEGETINIEQNQTSIDVYDNSDENLVAGSWKSAQHQAYLTENGVVLASMKAGAVYPDSADALDRMTEHPDFHGYYIRTLSDGSTENVNYLASYRFLIKIGNAYGKGLTYTAVSKSDIPGLTQKSYEDIRAGFANAIHTRILPFSNEHRKAFVFGIAMHTATDAFAHSTFQYNSGWKRITHPDADDISVQPRRYTMAYRVERNTLYRYQGKRTDVAVCHDFHAAGDTNGTYYTNDTAKNYYRIANISKYASQVNITNENVIAHYKMINLTK